MNLHVETPKTKKNMDSLMLPDYTTYYKAVVKTV